MPATTEFTIGENTFTVSRLKVKASLRGLKLVGTVVVPALAAGARATRGADAGAADMESAIAKAVEGLDCLPELLDLFAAVTKWTGLMPDGKTMRDNPTPLKDFVEQIFGGHPENIVEFVLHCVQAEYAGFLKADGPLGLLLQGAGPAKSSASPST